MLGHVELVQPKQRHDAQTRFNKHFRCDKMLNSEVLGRMQRIASTISGIEEVIRSDRKEATFVIIMKDGLSDKAATQTASDFMARVSHYLHREERQSEALKSSLAVYSSGSGREN